MTTLPASKATWATTWTRAFEQALSEPALLAAGAARARRGDIDLNINPGFATGKIPAGDGSFLRPLIDVQPLTDAEWEIACTAIATNPNLASSVLGGFSNELLHPANTGGVPLLPAPDQLTFACKCGADGPCVHGAALGYTVAQRFHTAPAGLFTLRGRPYKRLRTRIRTTNPSASPAPPPAPATRTPAPSAPEHPAPEAPVIPHSRQPATGPDGAGISAHTAFSATPRPAEPPTQPPAPLPRGQVLRHDPPPPVPARGDLELLISDAAHRAQALLDGHPDPTGDDALTDGVRLLSNPGGAAYQDAAAANLQLSFPALKHLLLAHRHGGPAAVRATAHQYSADPETMAQAEAAIQPLRPASLTPLERDGHCLTDPAAYVQLRYGDDSHWHPFTNGPTGWRTAPGHSADPADAYRAARRAQRARRV